MTVAKCRKPEINQFFAQIYKPGESHLFFGMRGAGKTHASISFVQRLMEGYYEGTPKNVILLTNVIFLKKTKTGIKRACPPNVHVVTEMSQIFPIVADAIEEYGRKDLLIVLLLDEAQNFLLGDLNGSNGMGVAMKQFCGILRKFQMMLICLSPTIKGLGPAFRNFLDAPNDSGNLTCTFEKAEKRARRYIERKGLNLQPRDLIFIQPGFSEPMEMTVVPTSSWTRDPEKIDVGEYAYDTYASATFSMMDFPFEDFVRSISNVSSYEVVGAIRDFYKNLQTGERTTPLQKEKIELALKRKTAWRMRDLGYRKPQIATVFDVSDNTIGEWTKGWKKPEKTVPEDGDG